MAVLIHGVVPMVMTVSVAVAVTVAMVVIMIVAMAVGLAGGAAGGSAAKGRFAGGAWPGAMVRAEVLNGRTMLQRNMQGYAQREGRTEEYPHNCLS